MQQNGKKGESVQKQLLNELHQSEKFNLTHKTSSNIQILTEKFQKSY